MWEGPRLDLGKHTALEVKWGLENRATWLAPPTLGTVVIFPGRSSLALRSAYHSLP